MPAIMKGIDPEQNIVNMPTKHLNTDKETIPILIGKGMANNAGLEIGDSFTIRWLDIDQTYDADEGTVVHIMDTENFKLDIGHIWVPIRKSQEMLAMEGEATYVTYQKDEQRVDRSGAWVHRDVNYLIQDIDAAIEADRPGVQIMFTILLSLAAMGIFNAQTLSIFRRKKEIGTLMALGMHKRKVVLLFTIEGALNAIFAIILTFILFGPLLYYFSVYGIPLPIDYSDMGLIIAKKLIPVYSPLLLFITAFSVFTILLIVSYIPSRKIAKMHPVDAIRGKTTE